MSPATRARRGARVLTLIPSPDRAAPGSFPARPAVSGAQRPVVTVSAGKTGLAVGEGMTLHVDVSTVTALSVNQLMLLVPNPEGRFNGYWELDLSAAEQAAGFVRTPGANAPERRHQ